jgi:methyl-accepting chemotaxis protein
MKFSTRLYAAFAVGVAFTLGLGVFAMVQVSALTGHTREISANWMPSVVVLGAIKSEMREFRTQELQHILSTDAKEMDHWEERMTQTLKSIDAQFAAFERLMSTDAERALFADLKRGQEARVDAHLRARKLSRAQKTEEAIALARGEIAQLRARTAELVDKLVEINERGADAEVIASNASASFATVAIPVALLLALAASAASALLIVRSTMRQLGGDPADTQAAVDRIAAGDLVTPVPLRAGDESSLMAALSAMRGRLADIVATIKAGSDEIRVASQEVARGNLDLSSRTEQQSSSLQETASALEEITGTVRATSENAGSASQLSRAASETAERGGRAVEDVVRTMQAISTTSKRVEDIIGVIDGIAFQTNILALNAAVEAARAGEQGRGFAVVASEVRALAQRSADAAREIKSLIVRSVGEVDEGTRIAGEAGGTMADIVRSVGRVNDIVGEISSAAHEQSTGIGQINEAVGQLDTVTQQNAALVEEAAAATRSMEEQADRLVEAVSVFRIDGTHSARAAQAARAASAPAVRPALARTAAPAAKAAGGKPAPKASAPSESWESF